MIILALSILNSQWDIRSINIRGRILYNTISIRHLKIIYPPNLTYWLSFANNQSNIVDLFITYIQNHINYNIFNISNLSSNHTLILLS